VGEQSTWDLRTWQDYLGHLYGGVNAAKGLDYTLSRLFAECSEVTVTEYRIPKMKIPEIYEEYSLELADVTAWTLAAANIMGVDLQSAIEDRYGRGCATCGLTQCKCNTEQFDHVYDGLN